MSADTPSLGVKPTKTATAATLVAQSVHVLRDGRPVHALSARVIQSWL